MNIKLQEKRSSLDSRYLRDLRRRHICIQRCQKLPSNDFGPILNSRRRSNPGHQENRIPHRPSATWYSCSAPSKTPTKLNSFSWIFSELFFIFCCNEMHFGKCIFLWGKCNFHLSLIALVHKLSRRFRDECNLQNHNTSYCGKNKGFVVFCASLPRLRMNK